MKTLYALLGAPGVGKSTFINNVSDDLFGWDLLNQYVVSPDQIRAIVQPPVEFPNGEQGISQENESYVWGIINEILDKKTQRGELIIMDATHSRNKAISNYKKYSDQGYRIVLVDFSDVPLEEILKRNKTRAEYKHVPEHIIETMYERIQNLDIPNWAEVIKPQDFVSHFQDIKHDWNDEFEKIYVIGDIHGCIDEFQEILGQLKINPDVKDKSQAIVFVGDYFDRGPGRPEVFRIMEKLMRNYYVLPLMGNHEEPFIHYKKFMQEITAMVHRWIILTLSQITPSREKGFLYSHFPLLDKFLKSPKETIDFEPEAAKLSLEFKGQSYKKLDQYIENLKQYPLAFKSFESLIRTYRFDNIPYVKKTSRNTFKSFLLSDIDYRRVSDFYKRLAQFCYMDFKDYEILITHGGLSKLPTKLTPTADMIRGVGGYGDALLCDETFYKSTEKVIGIHGHRNMSNIPIQSTPRTYNLNGDVELGIRALIIGDSENPIQTFEVFPFEKTLTWYRARQIEMAKQFKAKKVTAAEEGQGLLRLFQDHKHVDVKRLPNDIASINFTRKAFEKGVWDDITIKARGLFVSLKTDSTPENIIIARGYNKFFNLGERFGVDQRGLRNLVYPVQAFEKANGYLGILSVDSRDPLKPQWFVASKTTTQGDYAKNFENMIYDNLNSSLQTLMVEKNITLLFEVIDPVFDPHIQEYSKPELVLLEAIKNQLQFEKLPYAELSDIISLFSPGTSIRVKELVKECVNYNELNILIQSSNATSSLTQDWIEGYVFEDSAEEQTLFKVKTNWYSFWKKTRTTKDIMVRRVTKAKDNKLSKSEAIQMKSRLHTAEEIKVFKKLQELAEQDVTLLKSWSIPEMRTNILKSI